MFFFVANIFDMSDILAKFNCHLPYISECKSHESIFRFISTLGMSKVKGNAFEIYCKYFLMYDELLASKVDKVWLFDEFPIYLKMKFKLPTKDMGIDIVGVIPFKEELTYFTVGFLAEKLMAKVIAGEQGLGAIVKNILVGAISSGDNLISLRSGKENQLIITEGDKSDMILSALEHNPVGIILTNNIVPSQKVISKVSEREIPLILVTTNTCQAAKQVDEMEALLTKDSEDKIKLLTQLTLF